MSAQDLAVQTIDASPDDVFAAWITPELIEQWWGPEGFSTCVIELQPTVGGHFVFEMRAPSGSTCEMTGTYTKIDRPRLLSFEVQNHCNLDLPQGVQPQLEPSIVTVVFTRVGRRTQVVVRHQSLAPNYAWLAIASWLSALNKLATFVDRVETE